MTIFRFFRTWVNDKLYSLKLKKPPCHPQSKEPLWVPQWTKPVKRDDPSYVYDPNHVYDSVWVYDLMYSDLIGTSNYHYKGYDD